MWASDLAAIQALGGSVTGASSSSPSGGTITITVPKSAKDAVLALDIRVNGLDNRLPGNFFILAPQTNSAVQMVAYMIRTYDVGGMGTFDFDLPQDNGKIKITKRDTETAALLSGAVFGIYSNSACTQKVDEVTIGANGTGTSKDLPIEGGTSTNYYVKELTPPPNYVLDTTVHTVAVSANVTVDLAVSNAPEKGKLRIRKTDVETAEDLTGAVFGIYEDAACTKKVDEITIGASGTGTSKDLRTVHSTGSTYYVKELTPPPNFILEDTVHSVTLGAGITVDLALTNEPCKGEITLVKTDTRYGEPLAGVVFGLYSDRACETLLDTLTTDADGMLETEPLRYGTYYLKETQTIAGHIARDTVYQIVIADTTAITALDSSTVDATVTGANARLNVGNDKTGLLLHKRDGEGGAVTGVGFTFKAERADGAVYSFTAQQDGTYVCDSNGTLTELFVDVDGNLAVAGLPIGVEIVIIESTVPNWYFPQEEPTVVTLANQTMSAPYALTLDNAPYGRIKIVKKDVETAEALAGAVFGVYADPLCRQQIDEITTSVNGVATSKELPTTNGSPVTYYVKELTPPPAHVLDVTVHAVVVAGCATVELALTNAPRTGRVFLVKTDTTAARPLAGAVFGVYADEDCTELIDSYESGEDGFLNTDELRYGIYYLKEITAPFGHLPRDTVYKFTIADTSSIETVDGTPFSSMINGSDILLMAHNDKTGMLLHKRDNDGGVVTGAGFTFHMESKESEALLFAPQKDGSFLCDPAGMLSELFVTSGGDLVIAGLPTNVEIFIVENTVPDWYFPAAVKTVILANQTVDEPYELTITNTPFGRIEITKTDAQTAAKLSGAVFGIYSDSACKNKVDELTIAADGTATSKELSTTNAKATTYYVKELTAPANYHLDSKVHAVAVGAKALVKLPLTNRPMTGYVTLLKTDAATERTLAGAVFGLFSDSACTMPLGTYTTEESGLLVTDALRYGTYYLKEIQAPVGYLPQDTVYRVTIADTSAIIALDGSAVNASVTGSNAVLYVGNDQTRLILHKRDNKGNVVTGAGFIFKVGDANGETLSFTRQEDGSYAYDPAGTLTELFVDASGELVIAGLPVGVEILVIESTVTHGFFPTASENVTLTNETRDNPYEITVINTKRVKLGNAPTPWGWIIGGGGVFVLLLGAGAFLYLRRRRRAVTAV